MQKIKKIKYCWAAGFGENAKLTPMTKAEIKKMKSLKWSRPRDVLNGKN